MPYVKSVDRKQLFMTSLDMLVDQDSTARIIDAFVDSLNLKEMGFTNTSPSTEGRPAYSPEAMLKLYIYGHQNNIRSSRKLQRACHINIELKWLVKGAEPDFRTISDFRKNNHPLLKKVFLEFNKRFSDLMTGYVSVSMVQNFSPAIQRTRTSHPASSMTGSDGFPDISMNICARWISWTKVRTGNLQVH